MTFVQFTPEEIERCKKFASESTNNYGGRNQRNAATIARQIYQGKLGECAAYRFLVPSCSSLTEPDFQIYSAKQKTWKPDLACGKDQFHVKTMGKEQSSIYGLSWTFQFSNNSNRGGKDTEIFGADPTTQSFVVFVEIDLKLGGATIYAVLHAKRLFDENLFRDPKLDYLKGIKKCVYHSDLEAVGLVGKLDHTW